MAASSLPPHTHTHTHTTVFPRTQNSPGTEPGHNKPSCDVMGTASLLGPLASLCGCMRWNTPVWTEAPLLQQVGVRGPCSQHSMGHRWSLGDPSFLQSGTQRRPHSPESRWWWGVYTGPTTVPQDGNETDQGTTSATVEDYTPRWQAEDKFTSPNLFTISGQCHAKENSKVAQRSFPECSGQLKTTSPSMQR